MAKPLSLFKVLWLVGHQDWLRVGIRERILRFFVNPDSQLPYEFETDFFGLRYKGSFHNPIDWWVYFYGAYEKQNLFLIRDLMQDRSRPIGIDIGANCGVYAIFMSQFCGKVHAFEPYGKVLNLLIRNIEINGINNVVVHNFALGDKNLKLDLSVPKGGNTGTGSFIWNYYNNYVEVDVVSGDEYFEKLNLERIDFIKIDVEGFEKNVLFGLKKTLKAYRPTLLIEISPETEKSFLNVNEWDFLFKNYEVFSISYDRPLLIFFNRPSYRLKRFNINDSEINKGVNILCLPKHETTF